MSLILSALQALGSLDRCTNHVFKNKPFSGTEAVTALPRLVVVRVIRTADFRLLLNSCFLLRCEVPVPYCLPLLN